MNKKAFTLIEIMVGILIAGIVIIIGFQALNAVMVSKVKLIESTNIEKESFKFSQKFFEEIKKGGTIDYEEYFNRMAVNTDSSNIYSSGHYAKETKFGNFGTNPNGFYYCISKNGIKMGTGGCLKDFNTLSANDAGNPQRYGQYYLQFIDFNSNYDDDFGDEDGDGDIKGDDDDENLGAGPELFKTGTGVTELYLISADKKRRTFFRWTVKQDPNIDSTKFPCDFSNPKHPQGTGCLGTIEFIKLDGKDWGFNHSQSGSGYLDGVIDTWLVNKDFVENAGDSGEKLFGEKYRIKLFPDSINVKNFEVQVYPNADIKQSWKVENIDLAPYIRIKLTLAPSWKTKKQIKGKVPEFNISTTINLTDIFSW